MITNSNNDYKISLMLQTSQTLKIVALVPAAGIGVRASLPGSKQIPKQYQHVAGQPMLRHAVAALLQDARVQTVRVAVAPHDEKAAQALAGLPRTVWRPCGGETRAHTVLNALADANLSEGDWVLVHDAARPGLPATALARLIDACLASGQGGLLAMPVADTLKKSQDRGESATHAASSPDQVIQTIARDQLWLAQTPQMFKAGPLRKALEQAMENNIAITDEASAMEAIGFKPLLVLGSGRNVKVTWPEDFDWVGSWL